jgi:peptide/nickel transport system substrate-binding protein
LRRAACGRRASAEECSASGVGAGVPPGTFAVEPDLAERWEEPDDTTVVFYLRRGVRWHNKPPVNGRELTAEDVKFTYDRFLTEKGNPLKFMLDPVDRVEVVDRYTAGSTEVAMFGDFDRSPIRRDSPAFLVVARESRRSSG